MNSLISKKIRCGSSGYIALMATIIISIVLLIMAVNEGSAGWFARFNVLGTEAKEQAAALAEGCADQALAALITNPNYAGDATSTSPGGTCHVFAIDTGSPLVNIKTQAEVRGSYANLEMTMNLNQIHLGNTPSAPTKGTLVVITQVINDGSGTKQAADFTENVTGGNPSQTSFAGSASGVPITLDPGTYAVSQAALAGYATTISTTCSSATSAAISPGEIKFCTITNNDITTTLTVIASVTNNDSGTKQPSDFSLFIDGNPAVLGQTYNVASGAHSVSATTLSGYSASLWGYDCASTGAVTVSLGQNKTCVLNFDDTPPPAPICAETVMMLDRTGSMSNASLLDERNAATALVNLYASTTPPAAIGVGSMGGYYNSTAAQVPDNTHPVVGWLTTTYATIKNAITSLTSSNSSVGSDLSAAITAGNAELNSSRHVATKEKVLILVSDGVPNQPSGNTAFDTGFMSASSSAQNAPNDLWMNPTGAFANGGTDASDILSGAHRERYLNFGFGGGVGLPAGVSVTGITANVDAWNTSGGVSGTATATPAISQNGNYSDWEASSGTDISATATNDGDTSYIDTSASVETYLVQGASIPGGATINSVTITAVAKGAPSGTAIQLVAEKNGTLSIGPTLSITGSYAAYTRTMTTDALGAAWSLSEVNSWTNKFGVRTAAGAIAPRVTQFYVSVNYTLSSSVSLAPSAVSATYDQWTSSGGSKTTAVQTNDGSGSYISEGTSGQSETYVLQNAGIQAGATITSVALNAVAIESGGNASIALRVEKGSGAANLSDGPSTSLSGSYVPYTRSLATNPFTGSAWTLSEVNNWTTRFGVVRTNGNGGTPRVTQISGTVNYTVTASTTPLLPTSVGTYDEWSSNTGTSVNAVSANDGDTSYIDASQLLSTFTFSNSNVPAGSTITGVTMNVVARGSANGASIQLVAENGGAPNAGPNQALSTSYSTYSRFMPTNPLTGNAWTLSEVNAWTTKFGVRSLASASVPRVSQITLSVTYSTLPATPACQVGVDLSWNGGVSWSSEKTQTLTGAETTYTLGSASDDWSSTHTWSPSEFSNANFVARIHSVDPGASCLPTDIDHVDYLQLKVHYNQSVDPTQAALNAADAAKLSGTDIFTIHFGDTTGRNLLAQLASGATPNAPHQNGSYNDPGGVVAGDTGYISPSVQQADTGGDGNGFEVTPGNAFADGNGAASNIDGAADRHQYSGYNFSIPPNATISGIVVRPDWWLDSTTGTNSVGIELSYDGGIHWTAIKTEGTESTSDSNGKTVGSSADTWGRTWQNADFSPANFRVRITSNSTVSTRDFFLDWIPVRVYYSVIQENGDGDNFFIAPTSADMQGIFSFIGAQVCPAAANPLQIAPPTTGRLIVYTQMINNNGGTAIASAFTGHVSAQSPSQATIPGSASPTIITVNPGDYDISEDPVSGYNEIPGATCTSSGSSGQIIAGETRVCILTNDDIPPTPPPPNYTINTGTWQEVPTAQ